jgi:hypothetical protein
VTLPTQSPPDATEPDQTPARAPSSPAALIAVVGVSALVVILCVLGATLAGLFNFLDDGSTAGSEPEPGTLASDAGPLTLFDDGQYLVMRDVQSGTYTTRVPPTSSGCTWERKSASDGTASAVLESGRGEPEELIVVNIRETDRIFQSQGCGTWQRTAD